MVPKEGLENVHDIDRIPPAARQHAYRLLRGGVRLSYLKSLMAKLDQGKVYEWSVSNHFIRTGAHTRFCDWRFVFRARLDCVALNGARRWGANKDKQCLYPNEKLPYVLNGCMKHSNAIQRRHNAICNRLETAIKNMRGFKGVVRKDNAVPGCESRRTLRPDIVWIDEAAKTVKIVDVAVTSKNRKPPGQHHRRPPGRRGPGNHDRTGASTTAPSRCYADFDPG